MTAKRPSSMVSLSFVPALICALAIASPAGAASTVTLEAEDATLSGPTVLSEHVGFRGTGYADFGETLGEYIEWNVTAGEAGFYAVAFRYAINGSTPRPLELSVNGGSATVVDFPATGDWTVYKFTDKVEVQLVAGNNTIRLTAASSIGANLDQLRVSVIPDPDDIVTYEAEEATLVGPAISVQHEGYTGDGYADFGPNLGEYIEWVVNAPVDGFYTVAFRYALNDDPRPLLMTLNVAESTVIEFPPTNAWTNWALTEELELELEAGESVIRATAANNVGANVDSLILTLLVATEEENYPPTAISLDNSDVPEGVAGATVGILSVTDPNETDVHTYEVSDARFEVIDGVLMLKTPDALDADLEPTVSIIVTATDSEGASVSVPFTILVIPGAPFEVLLEAEDATFTRAHVGSAIPGFTGEGYLRFSPRNGAGVVWQANVPTAGCYKLKFRYTGPCESEMRLRVNGSLVKSRLDFPRVKRHRGHSFFNGNHAWNAWKSWRTVCIEVQLNAGNNSIRLDAIGRRRSFIDSLTILEKE